jgi:pathogenesis-related protein 1
VPLPRTRKLCYPAGAMAYLKLRASWLVLFGVFMGVGPTSCGGKGDDSSSDAGATVPSKADEFLSAHNRYRTEVTQPSSYTGSWTPIAALSWSSALEASAQSWAEHLRDTASCAPDYDKTLVASTEQGENIYRSFGAGFSATSVVDVFGSERSQYVYSSSYTYDKSTAHYTQIVWRNTKELGCAIAECPGLVVVWVCRYSPAGNVIGEQPY